MLEAYDEMPIFIPVDIMDDVVKLVTQKLLGSLGPGGTDSEALQGWLIKFGEDIKICTSIEIFVNWITNKSPTWGAYCAFMSEHLITLEKQPDIRLLGVV